MKKLDQIIQQFQSLDERYRLELLLDYANKLPPLPKKFHAVRNIEHNRVVDCQTPVYIFVTAKKGIIEIFADVADEAPTVKGLVSILIHGLNGSKPENIQNISFDLLNKLGLSRRIGLVRLQGLNAILQKIKQEILKTTQKIEK